MISSNIVIIITIIITIIIILIIILDTICMIHEILCIFHVIPPNHPFFHRKTVTSQPAPGATGAAMASSGSAARPLRRLLELCGERCGGGRLEGGVGGPPERWRATVDEFLYGKIYGKP